MHCNTERFNIASISLRRGGFLIPPECRGADAWSMKKRQLFLDTLLNGYDCAKLYFRDLRGLPDIADYNYELIDGRQRLQCIWDFLDGKIPLAKNFVLKNAEDFARSNTPHPAGGDCFADLTPFWREEFKSRMLDVVLIKDADKDGINEIMSRVNHGASLYAAAPA